MNLGFPEMLFLGLLALLLFGPKRLPEIGRQVGRFLAEFKRASNEFQSQLEDEVRHLETEAENSILPSAPPEGAIAKKAAEPAPAPEGSVAQGAASSHVSAQEQGANVGHQAANGGDGAQGA